MAVTSPSATGTPHAYRQTPSHREALDGALRHTHRMVGAGVTDALHRHTHQPAPDPDEKDPPEREPPARVPPERDPSTNEPPQRDPSEGDEPIEEPPSDDPDRRDPSIIVH